VCLGLGAELPPGWVFGICTAGAEMGLIALPNVGREWTTTAYSVVKYGKSVPRHCGSNRPKCYVASFGFNPYEPSGVVEL
jgi:hypothetical protein